MYVCNDAKNCTYITAPQEILVSGTHYMAFKASRLFIILDITLKVVLFNHKVGKMIDLAFKKFDILV